jgi:hypothetical protein
MAYGKLCEGSRPETQVAATPIQSAWANEFQDQVKNILGPMWYDVPMAQTGYNADGKWVFSGAEAGPLPNAWKWTSDAAHSLLILPIPWQREGMLVTDATICVLGDANIDGSIAIAQTAYPAGTTAPSGAYTTHAVLADPWNYAAYNTHSVSGLSIGFAAGFRYYLHVTAPADSHATVSLFYVAFKVQLDT